MTDDVYISTVFGLGPGRKYYHLVASFIDDKEATSLVVQLNGAMEELEQFIGTTDEARIRAEVVKLDPGFEDFCRIASWSGEGDILPYYGWDNAPLKFST